MTATEVNMRYELMLRMLGPTMGRIQHDFLDPLVQRTFRILFRANQLLPVPEIISEQSAEMDIEYLGPLSRAQKSDQVANIERYVATLGGMAQFAPEVLDVLDPVETAREIGALLDIPARITRGDKEVQQISDARKQQQQQMQMMQQMAGGGQAIQQLAEGVNAMKGIAGGEQQQAA